MPYTTAYDDYWYCSWLCGFKSEDESDVIKHENAVHNAVQTREISDADAEERTRGFRYWAIGGEKRSV